MTSLRGSVIVVTGATGAAGPAVVKALAGAGATVIAVGRDAERLEPLVAERVQSSVVDLLDAQATASWGAELMRTHGRVDGLVHLVGGWRGGAAITEVDLGDYEWLHANLVRTLQHASRALLEPISAAPQGRIVLISTTALEKPTEKNAIYLTAKAAAEEWTSALAHALRDTSAAAISLRVKALLTPQMREDKPDAKFPGYTPVDQLADAIVELFEQPVSSGRQDVLPG